METDEPLDAPSENSNGIEKGIVTSNACALVAFGLAYALYRLNEQAGFILTFSEFVLVPLGMGIIAMKFWVKTEKRIVRLLPYIVLNTIIALALSAIFMHEGVICLLIVSPLILGFMWCGVLIGKYIFLRKDKTLQVSTAFVFVLIFVIDTLSVHNYTNMVSDTMIIHAPKKIAWKYVASHPLNTREPDYWLFNIGLPCPVQSTISADSIGAQRKCIFSNGATFDERIVENKPEEIFTFDIVKQPADPEIIGHIVVQRGQFILKENSDGTTTLIGNSWYKLNVYPVWYYDLWAVDITRNVHLRVMNHIKTLAENDF